MVGCVFKDSSFFLHLWTENQLLRKWIFKDISPSGRVDLLYEETRTQIKNYLNFCDNGYHLDIVHSSINVKFNSSLSLKYLLPRNIRYILDYRKLVKPMWGLLSKFQPASSMATSRPIYILDSLLGLCWNQFQKFILSMFKTRSVIYEFKCRCHTDSIGRTSYLETRIKHITLIYRKGQLDDLLRCADPSGSAITEHRECAYTFLHDYILSCANPILATIWKSWKLSLS